MKRISFASCLLLGFLAYSQCTITGKNTLATGSTEVFGIENDNAQCTDCHLWTTDSKNIQIESDFRKNTISVKSLSEGKSVLSLSVLTSQGLVQCSKNIEVVSNSANNIVTGNTPQKETDCDINIYDYKETKYSEGIVGVFPIPSTSTYQYTWTAVYRNGDEKKSTEKVPQFPYSKENGITTIKLQAVSSKCIKNSSKTYEANFWKYF